MAHKLLLIFICALSVLPLSLCDSDEILNVFIVAHSHDDAGWLRTVDSYYEWEVQYIFETVITCLLENPDRKFIEVEMAFFTRWWNEIDESKKEQVRQLVHNGQLEFVNGGWVMNDEAVTNYVSVINQMTEGHLFILDNFGVAPRVAWHIDPFGASSVTPTLWAESGFEYFVINRIDYRLKDLWKETKELEFVWRGSKSLGESTQIFTHILDSHYCTPSGFDWEHGVSQNLPKGDGPPVIITDPPSYVTSSNVHARAVEFAHVAKTRAAWFKTPNVLIPFGCDFNFQNALMKYKNMDKLIEYINNNSEELGIRAQYSTLSDYFDAVKQTNQTWTVRDFDFFPYIDNDQSYWTGFYTSRPDLKQLCRETDSIMRTSEIILALGIHKFDSTTRQELVENMEYMRKAAALSQHHDAVTGTERRVTYRDYKHRLIHGAEAATNVSTEVLQSITQKQNISGDNSTLWNNLLNNLPTGVLVYNSLEFTRTQYQKLNVPISNVEVLDSTGAKVTNYEVHDALSYGETGYSLFFMAENVPPLGYAGYTVQQSSSSVLIPSTTIHVDESKQVRRARQISTMENEYLEVGYDQATGRLQYLTNKDYSVKTDLYQSMMYYVPTDASQTSGAYIFRPQANEPPRNLSIVSYTIVGSLVQELKVEFNESSITQIARLYSNLDDVMGNYLDLEMHLGPLNVSYPDKDGKEYITRFQTNVKNGDIFYTDDTGLEMQTRRTNYPNGRPLDYDEGVILAGNYYPVVSRMYIQEPNNWQFTIVTEHSHGGSSLQEGEAEIMLHRRLLRDDGRGVGQALDDFHQVSPRFFLMASNPQNSSALHRILANVVQYPMMSFFISSSNTTLPGNFAPLTADLPYNIRIISLKQRDDESNVVILRLMNIFEVDENPYYSIPTQVDLNTLFAGFTLSNIEERTLTTNMLASDNVRPQWNTNDETTQQRRTSVTPRDFVVTLSPMEIKSFWVTLNPSN